MVGVISAFNTTSNIEYDSLKSWIRLILLFTIGVIGTVGMWSVVVVMPAIEKEFNIKNTNRAVGTRISHHLFKKYGYEKLKENFLTLNFIGSAGQSFGAFSSKGLKLSGVDKSEFQNIATTEPYSII